MTRDYLNFSKLIAKFKLSITGSNNRTKKVLQNILLSFGVKIGSVLISLLLVPIIIGYINPIQYGIWIAISSVVSWMSFFDIGLGNGLRNRLASALALEEYEEAKKYVSTTYAVLSIISIFLLFLTLSVNNFFDWNKLLNISSDTQGNLNHIVLIVFISFYITFVVQTINNVLMAFHEPAKAALINLIGQVGVLLIILICKQFVSGDLKVLIYILCFTPALLLIAFSLYIYNRTSIKIVKPLFKYIDFTYTRKILNIGIVFFVIQIGALVLFQTANIILIKLIGPLAVTEYSIAYKLFSIVPMLFSIIMTPFWSAFTDAYTKNDYVWMKGTLEKLRKIWLFITIPAVILLLLISNFIMDIWLGDSVLISFSLKLSICVYIIGYTCMMLHGYFLNGIGKLRIQLYLYLIVCIVNIPLSIFFVKLIGVAGVAYSNAIMVLIMSAFYWVQSNKLVNNKAKGIWNQ